MILTAHQPAYLPWLGLFDKIAQAEGFCIFDVCPAEDSGFENRNRILSPCGEQWLTVPVRKGRHIPLSELAIAEDHGWQRKHWRSLELAYQKAPYWDRYSPGLSTFYKDRKWTLLVDLCEAMLCWFMQTLSLDRPIVRASSLGCTGVKSDLVLSMCQKMGASEYIFGSKGGDYADVSSFESAGIKVRFQNYHHPTYPQMRRGFVPHLSVVDLLMNVGPDSLQTLVNDAKVIRDPA